MTPWFRAARAASLLAAVAGLLGGCASLTAIDAGDAFSEEPQAHLELTDVPYHPQEALQCGPAALAEVLGWSGREVTPEALESDLFIPAREGTLQTEMLAQARARGRVAYRIPGTFDALAEELRAGHPVLVLQNLGLGWLPVWHYAVVVGYDPQKNAFILRSGERERHYSPLDRFRRTWSRSDRWAVIVVPPDRLPATAEPGSWLQAALDLEETGHADAARTAYEAGRTRWPAFGGLHVALMNLHYGRGELAAAEHAGRRGLEQAESRRGVLRNNLAMILLERGDCRRAEALVPEATDAEGPFADAIRNTRETIRERCAAGATAPAPGP